MKVFLLGATGSTGWQVLKKLVEEGHDIRVLVRNPQKLDISNVSLKSGSQVEVIKGEVLDMEKLSESINGCDAIVSALGTGKENSYTEIYSEGGRKILAAMRFHGIKRLITITSGLIDMSDPSTDNFFLNRIIRPNFNKVYSDQTRWETILDDATDIDWTCVRPTYLVDKGFTGNYRVKEKHCPEKGRKISRADLAHFMVKELTKNEFIHQKPVIAY